MSSNNKEIIDSEKGNSLKDTTMSKRQTEEFCLSLVESTSDSMYLVDENCRYLFVNSQHLSRMGMPSADIIGRSYEEFHSPEQTEIFVEKVKQVFETGKSVQQEHHSRRDGRYFLRTFSPIKEVGLNGQIIRVTVVSKDITEHKKAEEKLRTEMRFISNIIQASPAFFVAIDADGKIIMMNESFLNALGYSDEQVVGKDYLSTIVPERDRDLLSTVFEKLVISHEPSLNENHVLTRDDRELLVEWHGRPVFDGEGSFLYFFGVGIDITERKRADTELRKAYGQLRAADEQMRAQYNNLVESERSLRESEEKYRNIMESIDEAYFEVDLDGNMTFCNDSTCNVSGYTQSELINMNYRQYTSPEVTKTLRAIFNNIYKTGEKGSLYDFEVIRKDKRTRNMELSLNIMRNSAREAIGFRCIARDITARRQVEEEKRRLEERLQRAEKMEALGTLAGGVAHDLNNVLGVLVGYSELLLQNVPPESPFQRHATQIFKGGQRAAAIIQDLLTLTRRGVLVSETVNLNRVISDFMQTPEFEAVKSHHPGVTFKTSLDEELLNVKGSPMHLGKTVMNLLSNAAESITGLGEVLIKTENRYVDKPIHGYDTTQEGEYAVLTVSDTGSGISAADIGKIFEPFYTKKVMGRSGTGLGLAVVWGTVKDHDGYVDVESKEGKGTTFILYFPITREAVTKHEEAVPQSTYMGRGEHILVVDDVEGQRLLASAMLETLGYKVDSVASGEEAIEFVRSQPVDLLILDMIMDPGIDGLETYRRIRKICKDQKAVIVSGFAMTERIRKTQALGAGAYVKKPYLLERIGLAVRKELDGI